MNICPNFRAHIEIHAEPGILFLVGKLQPLILRWGHSRWVQAFPEDQDVHAVPSCLYLPCLQPHPSHHGLQQGPIEHIQKSYIYHCLQHY